MKKAFLFTLLLFVVLLTLLACNLTQVSQPTLPAVVQQSTREVAPTITEVPPTSIPTLSVSTPLPQPVAPTQVMGQSSGILDGQALVEDRCTTCHGLGPVKRKHTAVEWQEIIAIMMDQGAQLNADEQAAVLKYLTTSYGR